MKYAVNETLMCTCMQLIARCSTKVSQSTVIHQAQKKYNLCTFGQPTPITHPHLLKEGELVPGINLEEFRSRRNKLVQRILSHMHIGNKLNRTQIIIIPSASKVYMSEKIPYVFRQNTDFLYFTGCQEADCALIITISKENFTSTLFVQKKDEHSELWDGPRTGAEAAPSLFGVDQALPLSEFEKFFISLINENKSCVLWYDEKNPVQPELHKQLCQLGKICNVHAFVSPKAIFHEIRLIKSQAEIKLMQKSCDIASRAIVKTIEISKPGVDEHQLFANVDYECRMNGAEFLAYPPVVAGGKNANIIHYITNNQIVQDGDMVLMDAGCEYHGYSSDITRTWPVNGTFSPEQRVLYDIVLEVQKILIQRLKDMPTLDQLFHEMCILLGRRLQQINLIPNNFSEDKLLAAAYSYCPHHVSHYLGMDVHDTGKIPRSVKVKPGMIITVEPGIYVNQKNKFATSEFYGLGVRIEDDVLIRNEGPLILTRKCPKEIDDIEELAKSTRP
ncbi:probable Xaa-Pro aminopeptidase 3 isoform X2 [Cephus cinctus]|uniref:Probable Xaa-Pro aminopeptidase 3 isoform X2 n=1 Tax=Cephus cinctus TaxID=211228 RepID=A0AAJ7C4F6_CEPCN|nr:probable Xaa-Pro aminopeptidase 3 isoform X2 [Cephus cinctus]